MSLMIMMFMMIIKMGMIFIILLIVMICLLGNIIQFIIDPIQIYLMNKKNFVVFILMFSFVFTIVFFDSLMI